MISSIATTRPMALRTQAPRRIIARAQPANPDYDNGATDIVKKRRAESKERLNAEPDEVTRGAPGWMKDGNSNYGNLAKDLGKAASEVADKVTGKDKEDEKK